MKILICTIELPPIVGGAGVYLSNVISTLLDNEQNEITLICPENANALNNDGVLITIKSKPIFKSSLLGHIITLASINLEKFDKIVINDLTYALIFSIFYNKYIHKIIYFAHGLEPELVFSQPRSIYKLIKFKRHYFNFLNATHRNAFVSADLIKKFKEICSYSRVDDIVCYSPINIQEFSEIDLSLNLPTQFILSTGRIIEEKGYPKMSLVMFELFKNFKDLHWVIIGDGSYKENLLRQSKLNFFSERVLIIDNIDRHRLSTYYSKCRAFLLLSTFRESLGLVYLEAKSFGAVCFSNNIGGVNEVLDESDYMFNPFESTSLIVDKISQHLNTISDKDRSFKEINLFSKSQFNKCIFELFN
nr:glycosyltransferase family 4 protein [uncultured Limnohabitans sp.]